MENYSTSLDESFQALADPTRRAILKRLISGKASVKELAEPFSMGLPSFMKHIKVLERSGLINSKKEGRVRTCQLETKQLMAVETWLSEQRQLWQGRMDRMADYIEKNLTDEEMQK